MIFPLLDPVTKSKVVMVKGEKEKKKYFEERLAHDPASIEWLEATFKLPGFPGSFPSEELSSKLRDEVTRDVLARCRDKLSVYK